MWLVVLASDYVRLVFVAYVNMEEREGGFKCYTDEGRLNQYVCGDGELRE